MPDDKSHILYESDVNALLNENLSFLFLHTFSNKYSSRISPNYSYQMGEILIHTLFWCATWWAKFCFPFFSQILYQLSVNCLVELRVALVKITVNIKPLSLKIL